MLEIPPFNALDLDMCEVHSNVIWVFETKSLAMDVLEAFQTLPISKDFSVTIIACPNMSTGLKKILCYLTKKSEKIIFPFYDGDATGLKNSLIDPDGT